MRIDGTHGIENFGPSNVERPTGQGKPTVPNADTPSQAQKVAANQADLVNKARDCSDVNPSAVERARKLLDSGALDTPQAAQAAAEAILDGGI